MASPLGDTLEGSVTVDADGRLVLPLLVRRALKLQPGDALAFRLDDEGNLHLLPSVPTPSAAAPRIDPARAAGLMSGLLSGSGPEFDANLIRSLAAQTRAAPQAKLPQRPHDSPKAAAGDADSNVLMHPSRQQRGLYTDWQREHVRWSDTDRLGHANNLAFAAFCETGRTRLLRTIMGDDATHPALLVVADMRLRFLAEAHWPDEVDVGTCVIRIGNRSCVMAQGLFTGAICFAVSETVLVNIDPHTRRSAPLPDAVRRLLQQYAPSQSP
jgi:acyl-CoA thioester hydrolase